MVLKNTSPVCGVQASLMLFLTFEIFYILSDVSVLEKYLSLFIVY